MAPIITNRVELLAPARDLEAGRAAVDCGADAVYIGGPGFGARSAATNSVDDIAALVCYARPFGVRIYATLNTLLFDNELAQAERVARELIAAGVDAFIVQDMAYLRMGLGDVEFHASTQTANITPEDVAFFARAGFSRVVLERALSPDEIRRIREASNVELEAFVHGAVCVGYSGRCFLSKSIGERSGNRGNCSQPCRLAWNLTDEANNLIIKDKHLLSVRDMDLSVHIGELLDAGVTSFKIEGRLKDTAYVRNTVGHYRAILDKELSTRPHLERASVGVSILDFAPDPAKSFTRGGGFDTPKSVGEYIGRVEKTGCDRTGGHWFTLEGNNKLKAGDGISFITGGTNINRVDGNRVYPNKIDGIATGSTIYRNYDHAFTRALERSRARRKIDVSFSVEVSDEFEPAKDHEKMADTLRTEFFKSGDTIFEVKDVKIKGEVRFVPISVLAKLRREVLQKLLDIRNAIPPEHRQAREDLSAKFPRTKISAVENVTNRLAEQFYRDHGVVEFESPLELSPSLVGAPVMRTRHCLRRELGECLRENPKLKSELYLTYGNVRYRLDFDCKKCEMTIHPCPTPPGARLSS